MRKIAYVVFGLALVGSTAWVAQADNKPPVGNPTSPATITITAQSALTGNVGQYFNPLFSVKGGTGPYTFSYTGSVPTGTFVSTSCFGGGYGYGYTAPCQTPQIIVYGTPTQAGNFTATFTVFDHLGHSDKATFTFVISGRGTIQVLSPNGGERYFRGQTINVSWQATLSGPYTVYVQQANPTCYGYTCGPIWYTIGTNVKGTSLAWKVGYDATGNKIPDGQYTLAVYQANGSGFDNSDGTFGFVTTPPPVY